MSEELTQLFGSHLVDLTLLDSGCIIVDAGASTGAFIRDIKARVSNPIIYAIEPGKKNFYELHSSFLTSKTTIVFIEAALVGKNRGDSMTFYDKGSLREWGNVNNLYASRPGKQYSVNTISLERLSAILPGGRISYLKMDIEGSEEEVVEDMTEETAKKIHQISMELHEVSHVKMAEKLAKIGYHTIYKGGELYAVYHGVGQGISEVIG
jgi:FkbM family methyltransferase